MTLLDQIQDMFLQALIPSERSKPLYVIVFLIGFGSFIGWIGGLTSSKSRFVKAMLTWSATFTGIFFLAFDYYNSMGGFAGFFPLMLSLPIAGILTDWGARLYRTLRA